MAIRTVCTQQPRYDEPCGYDEDRGTCFGIGDGRRRGNGTAGYGVNLNGRTLSTLSAPRTTAVVLFFLATDCPVSSRYQPEIARLSREFAERHVAMWVVYPNPAETAAGVRDHQREFTRLCLRCWIPGRRWCGWPERG